MMRQWRFILGWKKKSTILVRDVDNWEGYAFVGAGCEIIVPSFQFDCEPKSALKK